MPALLSVTSTDTCVTSFFTKYRPDDPLTSHLPLHYDANLPHGTQFGPSSADAITEYAEKNDLLFTTKTDLLFAHLVLHGKPSSEARNCCGVIQLNIGWSGKRLVCGKQRKPEPASAAVAKAECGGTGQDLRRARPLHRSEVRLHSRR